MHSFVQFLLVISLRSDSRIDLQQRISISSLMVYSLMKVLQCHSLFPGNRHLYARCTSLVASWCVSLIDETIISLEYSFIKTDKSDRLLMESFLLQLINRWTQPLDCNLFAFPAARELVFFVIVNKGQCRLETILMKDHKIYTWCRRKDINKLTWPDIILLCFRVIENCTLPWKTGNCT